MTPDTAAPSLQDRAVPWSIGELPAHDLVQAARDALAAGLDSPTLRRLAALTPAEAAYDVREPLPGALDELGLVGPAPGGTAGQEADARVLGRRLLRGSCPRGHWRPGHTAAAATNCPCRTARRAGRRRRHGRVRRPDGGRAGRGAHRRGPPPGRRPLTSASHPPRQPQGLQGLAGHRHDRYS